MIDFLKSIFSVVGWVLCAVILLVLLIYSSMCAERTCLAHSPGLADDAIDQLFVTAAQIEA